MILLLILIPLLFGLLILAIKKGSGIIALSGTALSLLFGVLFFGENTVYTLPWAVYGINISFRFYHFSGFIILSSCFFAFLVSLYSISFLRSRPFYAYILLTLAFVNGAVLSDNLALLLFFWEGLVITLFAMISAGGRDSYRTAAKAFIIEGAAGLFMVLGAGIVWKLAGTLQMSRITLGLNGLSAAAFIFLMIGAVAKGGCMPFHSWIPDAAKDAPLPFMALLPASLDKLLGIYFLTRISLDLFRLDVNSWLSTVLMILGAVTILLAVMMALIQKEYKKLLSYHAISQVGYMILGVGTAVPAGIIGGIFHMINNALYKCCLFLTGGAVEKQTGTTNLEKLGGIGLKMPVTFICFLVTALSISGVPPFNGFFSKELIYGAALKRGVIFYLAAVIGTFFTAASFLKLGHSAFLGKLKYENAKTKEVPWVMLVPMIVIAAVCIIFGVFNYIPVDKLIRPVLSDPESFSGMHIDKMLFFFTLLVLAGAFVNHLYGVKKTGSGLKAVDHIHYAPVLKTIYAKAEEKYFDPYEVVLKFINLLTRILWYIDRKIDWIYENLSVQTALCISNSIRKMHTGNYVSYIIWALFGAAGIMVFMVQVR